MQVHSFAYDLEAKSWSVPSFPAGDSPRTLVLAFGAPEALTQPQAMAELARAYPRSVVVGCSSAGEIHGTTIRDKSLSVTVTKLDRTDIVMTSIDVASPGDSFATGQALAKKLSVKSGLRAVMILSEGLNVNGSELVRGVNSVLEESIVVTGGLSGDGTRFKQTWVAVGGALKSNVVAAVGFYGDYVQIGHGSKGGWDKFGPERVVTKSEGNVLFELDGKPALELYKEYLGEKAKDLPSSGLLFPLALRSSNKDDKLLVRTLLAVDHEKNSLTFAGDIPKGYLAQLMKADFDRLIGGASLASAMAKENGTPLGKDSLVVAISCVGRRLVLGDRTEEEIEAVLEELPREQKAHITGFYSYGEISPYASGHCDLHNQTMTLTVFTESPTPLPRHAAAAAKRTVDQEDEKTARDLSAEARRAAMSHDAELDWGSAPKVTTPAGFRVDSFAFDLAANAWSVSAFPDTDSERTLVLAFGAPEVLGAPDCIARLAKAYPRSLVLGCSSAGEIHGTQVKDNSVSVTVARFAKTNLQLARADVAGPADSFTTGQTIARKLAAKPGLRGVMILSEGLNVNGSELVRGVNSVLDESIVVTGGLSGDGTRFKQTWVAIGGALKSNVVAAVGFYGDYVQIGHGSKGGWDKFGPERVVTKSEGNVLFELDGKPALQLYKEYLGEKAKDLPSSGLLFPLALRSSNKDDKILVRTLLAVDHEKNSLTFAGDIPKGYLAQLMKADFDRLIGGASLASAMAKENGTPLGKDSLVVAISCVGRRLVLGDRTEEEIEAVLEELPREQKAHITGFYSYGEISPYASGHCDLHNQTMTLTVFTESPTPLPRHAGAAAPSSAAAAVRPGAAASVRPPVAPPPAPARPSPMATGQHHAVRSASPGDIDAELTTANTDTRQLPMNEGFAVNALSYDLKSKAWSGAFPELDSERTLVLAFGSPDVVGAPDCMSQLARAYPKSIVVGCSSAGEIHGTQVRDESLAVTIARFERTGLQLAAMDVASSGDSFSTGQMLAKKLGNRPSLRGVMILSEGLNVNGSELVRGINSVLDESIVVTGGLSGDGTRFKQTWVAVGSKVKGNVVAAVGFYGDYVQIGHGSKGGWDKFGPERVVTKSVGNVLYELDGKPALQLYKEYLGDKAKDLPSSGLLFPLSLRSSSKDDKLLVRTLLAVDHEKNSLTFAGDIPRGYLAQLMKADFDRLIGGASLASAMAAENGSPMSRDALVVAISCVGRRLVLGDRTEEEVEAVLEALPQQSRAQITGFYSYGEISPYASGHCDLHNQTMTLTVFTESKTPLPRKIVKSKAPPLPAMVPAAPASGPMHTGVSATTPSMLVPSPAPAPTRTPIASPPPVASASAPPPPVAPGQARVPGGPVTRVPIQASGTTGATVQKQRRGDVTLVTVSGRLTESFKGESVGRDLRGTVAIDLGGVERITSFGVREWLAMLAAMQEVRRFYLLRCSEAVVNQLGMIRKFAGTAQIVSFFAPYLCTNCGDPFERGFDCEREAEAIRNGRADAVTCPHCTADGKFDDDARSYFAFAAAHLNTPVPPEIRALQDELDAQAPPAPRDAVDKTVEGNVTRVRVQTRLGNNVRWKRVLDGIEGALVIDLGGVTGIEPAGLTNFEQALNGLGAEVTSIAIDRCPAQLVERFAQVGTPRRVSVTSANLDAYCRSCAVHRTAHVSIQEHGDALAQNTPPRVNCKRCNGEVELRGADLALNYLRSQMQGDISRRPSLEVPMSLGGLALGKTPDSRRTDDVAAGAAPATSALKGRPIGMPIAIGALSLTVVVLVVMQMSRATAPTAAAHPNATTGTPTTAEPATKDTTAATTAPAQPVGWMQNVDLPPSWVERPFVLDGDNAFVVGKGELSPTPEAAIAQARNDAIVRLMKQVQQELAGTPTAEFLQARMRDPDKNTSEAIAERYMKQFGTTAAPERVDAALRKRDSSVEGFARYKLSKAAYQGIVNAYRETMTLQGMTIARFFPLLETTLHADGDLIVLSVQRGRPAAEQGVRAGDVLVSVAGRPVGSIDSLVKVSNEVWGNTTPRSTMSVDIESAGAKHTIRFFKPVPPNP